jgi:hypothetical protein
MPSGSVRYSQGLRVKAEAPLVHNKKVLDKVAAPMKIGRRASSVSRALPRLIRAQSAAANLCPSVLVPSPTLRRSRRPRRRPRRKRTRPTSATSCPSRTRPVRLAIARVDLRLRSPSRVPGLGIAVLQRLVRRLCVGHTGSSVADTPIHRHRRLRSAVRKFVEEEVNGSAYASCRFADDVQVMPNVFEVRP